MTLTGGCFCQAITYRLAASPLIIHACHCRDCQRLTGSAFVINLWIERQFVEGDHARAKYYRLTAGRGHPHDVFYCEGCGTRLWSHYHRAPGDTLLLRAGTLDDPAAVAPNVHIFTRSKLPWIELPKGVPAFAAMYRIAELWPPESQERLRRNVAAKA